MKRSSGILLHVSSLPSRYGIGDLGPEAYKFADFLAASKQSYWQILPLNPTETGHGNSPYSSMSTFAANTLLISPEFLVEDGFLLPEDIASPPAFQDGGVDYETVTEFKTRLLDLSWERSKPNLKKEHDYYTFCAANELWLPDYALFKVLKAYCNKTPWNEWPVPLRDRDAHALDEARTKFHEDIEREMFCQYLFSRQWSRLKAYCNDKGIQIIGDIPIYVNQDSAEVWRFPHIFRLNADKTPTEVAGVPPDYFSQTGQRWGNPVYNWDELKNSGYGWWIQRMERTFALYNVVRIDHFRGLVAYWEIPAHEQTAVNGKWVEAPARDFFNTLLKHFACFPVIVEDLGTITPDVKEVMEQFSFPGMKVLLFAFGENNPKHIYLPHMYAENYVAYTGTHDTNTLRGWFDRETTQEQKQKVFSYIGHEVQPHDIHWAMIRLLMLSRAYLTIIPLQDVLCLGEEARMNKPSTLQGNWRWRLLPGQLNAELSRSLGDLTWTYGRA